MSKFRAGVLAYTGQALCVAIIVLVIVLLLVGVTATRRYDRYLAGLWVGDPAFLKEALLRDIQLFIAPREDGCRQGYLIITNTNGGFVSNQAIELRERPGGHWWSALRSTFRAENDAYAARCVKIEYDGVDSGGEPPMPETLKMSISILGGTLTLYDGEKIYAFLKKDLLVSAAAVAAYMASPAAYTEDAPEAAPIEDADSS